MKWWQKLLGRKASQTRGYIGVTFGTQTGMARNFEDFSEEAYKKNVIAFRCINLVALSASQIPWELYKGDREIEEHPLLTLLKRPNPLQGQQSFFESLMAFRMLSGNGYLEAVAPSEKTPPRELYTVRSDRMVVVPGPGGMPKAYVYKSGSYEKSFPVDPVRGLSNIMHWKTFNPLDDWYGMSPVEAAVYSIDIFNEQGKHNFNLIRRGAVPSGVMKVLSTETNPSGSLTDEQFQRIQAQIEAKYSGADNAGRPMLLEGGMEWQQMGMSLKDMDWINSKNTTARDIANAFGVPPMLVNIAGDNTYANYAEARLAMYEENVIPTMKMLEGELNVWLTPRFGDGLRLQFNVDEIPAIADKRRTVFDTMSKASFLTVNEKRNATGYESLPNWDVIMVGNVPMVDPAEEVSDEQEAEEPEAVEEETPKEPEDEEMSNALELEGKVFNLITGSEKRRHWRLQQEKRKALESAMAEDVGETLDEQNLAIKNSIADSSNTRIMEFAALEAIHKYKDDLEAVFKKHYTRIFKYFGDPIVGQGKSAFDIDTKSAKTKYEQAKKKYIKEQTAEKVSLVQQTTEKKVRNKIKKYVAEAIDSGETNQQLASKLYEDISILSKGRARTIARTEVAAASINSELEAVKSLDIPDMKKEWVSIQDDRTRDNNDVANHLNMNGKRVGINEKFHVEPDTEMDGPLDNSAGPEHVVNCRCALVYTRGE